MPSVDPRAMRRECSALLVRVLDAIVQEKPQPPTGKEATQATLPALSEVGLLHDWASTLQQVATVGYDPEDADSPGAPSLPLVLCAPLDAEISPSSGARRPGAPADVRMVAHWVLVGAYEFERIKGSLRLHARGGLQHMQLADCSALANQGEQLTELRQHLRKVHAVAVSAGHFDASFVEDGSGRLMLSDLVWHVSTMDEWMSRFDEPRPPLSPPHLYDMAPPFAHSTGSRSHAADQTRLQRSTSEEGSYSSYHEKEWTRPKAGNGGALTGIPPRNQPTSSIHASTATSASASASSSFAPARAPSQPVCAPSASAGGCPAPTPVPTSSASGVAALSTAAAGRPTVVPLTPRSAFWSQLEASLFLGKYAGGQQMSRCASLLSAVLPMEALSAQQRSRYAAGILSGWRSLLDAIRSKRDPALSACQFPPLPAGCGSSADLERRVSWSAHVLISARHLDMGEEDTPQDDPAVYNAFLQGLLFGKERAPERERHAGQKWPLVGLFDPSEGIDVQWGARRSGAPEVMGVNGAFKYADCHMHFVQGQEDRRFGSDMAQFRLLPSEPVAHCWVVSFDAIARRVDATLVIIVEPSLEDLVSGCIRAASQQLPSDHIDLRELATRLRSKLPAKSATAVTQALAQLMQ